MTQTLDVLPTLDEIATSSAKSLMDDNNKNMTTIKCQRCSSVILLAHTVTYSEHEYKLPQMSQKKQQATITIDADNLTQFWRANDQFTFENAGFTFPVDGVRYITCSECEYGPIGYVDKDTKEHFVALQRVKHDDV